MQGPYFPDLLYSNHSAHPVFNLPPTETYRNTLTHQTNVAGEGDVITVLYSDGSYQMYFMPVSRFYNNSCPYCITYNMNPINNTWFIRSISNPISPAAFAQTYHNFYGRYPPSKSQTGGCVRFNGYQLKFHNDNATSTTDIHYFYPSPRPITRHSVQVDALTETNVARKCSKPCCSINQCNNPCCSENQQHSVPKSQCSIMSVESQIKGSNKKMTKERKRRRCRCTKDHGIIINDDSCDNLCGCETHNGIPPGLAARKYATPCPCQLCGIENDSETSVDCKYQ